MISVKRILSQDKKLELEIGKRHLVGVMIVEVIFEGCGSGEKKRKGQVTLKEKLEVALEVVLEDQYRLHNENY